MRAHDKVKVQLRYEGRIHEHLFSTHSGIYVHDHDSSSSSRNRNRNRNNDDSNNDNSNTDSIPSEKYGSVRVARLKQATQATIKLQPTQLAASTSFKVAADGNRMVVMDGDAKAVVRTDERSVSTTTDVRYWLRERTSGENGQTDTEGPETDGQQQRYRVIRGYRVRSKEEGERKWEKKEIGRVSVTRTRERSAWTAWIRHEQNYAVEMYSRNYSHLLPACIVLLLASAGQAQGQGQAQEQGQAQRPTPWRDDEQREEAGVAAEEQGRRGRERVHRSLDMPRRRRGHTGMVAVHSAACCSSLMAAAVC